MKKFLIFFLMFLFILVGSSCSSSKKAFDKKRTHSISGKDYKANRGLMLLENTQLGRNKYFYSKNNQKKIRTRKK